jgi:hypothetical protein
MSKPSFYHGVRQKIHAQRRAEERFNLNLDEKMYYEINSIIHSGGGIVVAEFPPEHRSIQEIFWRNKFLRLVYDHFNKKIVTFLPMDIDPQKFMKYIERRQAKSETRQMEGFEVFPIDTDFIPPRRG